MQIYALDLIGHVKDRLDYSTELSKDFIVSKYNDRLYERTA
jgi:hypothetical protein